MPKASQRKGRDFEIEARNMFRDAGLEVRRHDLYETDDLTLLVRGEEWIGEAKRRANGIGGLHRMLEGKRFVIHRGDRQEPLVTVRAKDFIRLVDTPF